MSAVRTAAPKVSFRTVLTDPLVRPMVIFVFVLLAGMGVAIPLIPLFARSFGVGYDGTGFLIATYGVARLFGDLVAGPIVDRRGERWTAVAGLLSLAFFTAATGLAPSFAFACLFWGLSGIGSALVHGATFSYILKAAPKDRMARTLSFFFGAFNVGFIAGGAIGGFVADSFGVASPLFTFAAIALVGVFVYVRWVPALPPGIAEEEPGIAAAGADTPGTQVPLPSRGIVRDLLRLRGFTTALFLNFTYLWFVAAVFNTLFALFAKDVLGMSTVAIGVVFSIAIAAELAVLFPAGTFADRYGRKAVLLPSLLALTVTIVAVGWATSPMMLTVLLSLLAFSSGFAGVPPAAMLSDVVPPEHSGRAVGAFRFCGDLGFVFGPLIAGAAAKSLGFKAAFALSAIPAAIALVMTMRTPETLRRDP